MGQSSPWKSCCESSVYPNSRGREPRYAPLGPAAARRRIERAFRDVHAALIALNAPVSLQPRLAFCKDVRADRERGNRRAFFHVGHKGDWTVCHDGSAGRLSDCHLYGLVLHEFGHPIAMKLFRKSRQEDADRAIFKITGIPILYRTPWVVQWIVPGDVRLVRWYAASRRRPPADYHGIGRLAPLGPL
jgi:hypothetical protein